MKKRNTWNLLEQLDRLPIEETEESRQRNAWISKLFFQILAGMLVALFVVFGLKLLPQELFLDIGAGCLGVAMAVRFFLAYYYGTVFTSYSYMADKGEKRIQKKKEQALFLTILCVSLLFHIAFRSVFGTSTWMLLTQFIFWYLFYTVAFHFYAKSHPYVEKEDEAGEEQDAE